MLNDLETKSPDDENRTHCSVWYSKKGGPYIVLSSTCTHFGSWFKEEKKIHLVMLCSFIVLESFSRVHRVGFFGGCGGGCKKHTKPSVLDMYKKIKQMWAVPLLPDIWWRWVCWTVLCIPHDEIRRFSLHWYPHNWITKSGLKNPHQCTSIFDAKVKQRMVHILLFCSVLKLG